jgi:dihydroorotase
MEIDHLSGLMVLPEGKRHVRVSIDTRSGVIDAVHEIVGESVDTRVIFPGFIDIHVHAREYPRPDAGDNATALWESACTKETFETAGLAAVNGGVTHFAAMPNDPAPPDNATDYSRKLEITKSSLCPVTLYGLITKNSAPWADIPYKLYLDASSSGVAFSDWKDVTAALERYKGCRVFFHAEDPEILAGAPNTGPRWKTRPPEAENAAVAKILDLTAKLGLRSHICHVSTKDAVQLIEDFNREAHPGVTCEATPHHLYFSVDEAGVVYAAGSNEAPDFSNLESNPPLRSEQDRRFLIDALKSGLVDVLATDHAPHTIEDKIKGAAGMPHLDTLGPFAGWLINYCGFSHQRIAQILAEAPGRILASDLEVPHGAIASGFAASFTELDLGSSTMVEGERIAGRGRLGTRCGWSPFNNMLLPASVCRTIIRGRVHLI